MFTGTHVEKEKHNWKSKRHKHGRMPAVDILHNLRLIRSSSWIYKVLPISHYLLNGSWWGGHAKILAEDIVFNGQNRRLPKKEKNPSKIFLHQEPMDNRRRPVSHISFISNSFSPSLPFFFIFHSTLLFWPLKGLVFYFPRLGCACRWKTNGIPSS